MANNRHIMRRGVLAATAALVAAAAARLSGAERADAGHDAATAPSATNVVHLGVINDGGNAANNETATNVTATTVVVANGGTAAIRGRQLGATGTSFGVEGISGFTGVTGSSVGNTNGTSGVFGSSNVIGVRGFSVSSFAQSVGMLGFLTTAAVPFPSCATET